MLLRNNCRIFKTWLYPYPMYTKCLACILYSYGYIEFVLLLNLRLSYVYKLAIVLTVLIKYNYIEQMK